MIDLKRKVYESRLKAEKNNPHCFNCKHNNPRPHAIIGQYQTTRCYKHGTNPDKFDCCEDWKQKG